MQIQPYLFFDGRADEAIEFYKNAAGAEVEMLMRYRESPDPAAHPPGMEDKIMHAHLRIGDSAVLISDGHCQGKAQFEGFALAITTRDESSAERVFSALSAGGKVQLPLTKTFFSPRFGMLFDKFGVMWMVMVQSDRQP